MGTERLKYIGMSKKYKGVMIYTNSKGEFLYQGKVGDNGKIVNDERIAAINVDKQLIQQGKKPVNILVAK